MALRIRSSDSASSAAPYTPESDMQPNPMAETESPLVPRARCAIFSMCLQGLDMSGFQRPRGTDPIRNSQCAAAHAQPSHARPQCLQPGVLGRLPDLEGLDGGLLLQGEAYVVQAVDQTVLAERVDVELVDLAIRPEH